MRVAAIVIVAAVFVLGCAVAAIAGSGELARGRSGGLALFVLIAAYVPYAAVGSILVIRRPRNLIGWVLLAMGWTFAVSFLPIDATARELQTLAAPPLQQAIAWLTEFCVPLTFALFALLAFLFPTGRLPVGRWRRHAAAVLLLQGLLGDAIGGQTVAVAGSTLLAAALFRPLRRRVQTAVDHRFDRARYDAQRTTTDFAERLRSEVDLASLSGDIVGIVDTALHPSRIGVWIRRSDPTIP